MSKPNANPTDVMVAQRLGELEMTKIRMGWALEQQQQHIQALTAQLEAERTAHASTKDALVQAHAELAQHRESPRLPLEQEVNGHAKPH